MNVKYEITKCIPDRLYIQLLFFRHLHKRINLEQPKAFNEKLQWLKLYDRNPEYTKMVDKYAVKQYVSEKIGSEFIIPTLGVWDNPEDINFSDLPDRFVLKWNHDSGSIVICTDKSILDRREAVSRLKSRQKFSGFWYAREWPYKDVVPKVIAEKYIEDSSGYLNDYKLMCFNGKVRCSFVCTDRFSGDGLKVTFYDRSWNQMPFSRHYPVSDMPVPRPKNYDVLVHLAEKLSEGIPFVRVDFYDVNDRVYFGEMTFYPGSGLEEFDPEKWDYVLGSWLELPVNKLK